ncbi:MAG: methyltransferase domain-containing protein [Candidatus Doudnabacteria bacterium]|nr:methyltransferase domain-containing protein [Candidatus Doudnabacteria bacterium]
MKDNWDDQQFATDWDETSAVKNPNRLALLELLTAIVSDNYVEGKYILDLGCGSGLVEQQILEKLPNAKFVGVDASDIMLAKSKERISEDQLITIKHNLEQIDTLSIPPAEYQIAFTSFALHEISSESKRKVFKFIYDNLSPNGFYILVDRFKIDAQNLNIGYSSQWKHTLHPEWKGNLSFADYTSKMSVKDDSPDTLEDQLAWLRQLGFKADCLQLQLDRALIFAIK